MTTPDILQDFSQYVDWLNPVTLTLRGTGVTYTITHAHRNQVTAREHRRAGGDVRQGDTIWQFPIAESTDPIPLGSTLRLHGTSSSSGVSDDEIWTIIGLNKQVWSSKWEALCRNLAVSEGLNTRVDVLQAAYSSNSDGEQIPSWGILAFNTRAKIQLVEQRANRNYLTDDPEDLYEITFQSDPGFDASASYRVADPAGLIYGILSFSDLDQIDTLPKATCRLLTGYSSSGIA